jgi:hypothetical protein
MVQKTKGPFPKEPRDVVQEYYSAKRIKERWFFLIATRPHKTPGAFYAYSPDGWLYYTHEKGVWGYKRTYVHNLGDPYHFIRTYPPVRISYEHFLKYAPKGPYPLLEGDPELYVGWLDYKDEGLYPVLQFANEIHHEQKDRGNYPYLYHLVWVAEHVDKEAKKVALLHDSMEDCGENEEHLRQIGLSEKEVAAVRHLTRTGNETTDALYFAYANHIKESDPLAYKVKQADLLMNMDVRRIPEIGVKDVERAFKYEAALLTLGEAYLSFRSLLTSAKPALITFFAQHKIPSKDPLVPPYASLFYHALPLPVRQAYFSFRPYRTLPFILEKCTDALLAELPFEDLLLLFSSDFEARPITPNGTFANPYVKEAYRQSSLLFRANFDLHTKRLLEIRFLNAIKASLSR